MDDEVNALAGISPLIIIPCNDFGEVVIKRYARLGVKDRERASVQNPL
jgi:hypothetical protein